MEVKRERGEDLNQRQLNTERRQEGRDGDKWGEGAGGGGREEREGGGQRERDAEE